MPIGYVYMISSSTGNYIGSTRKTVEERFKQHKCELYRKNKKNCRSVDVLKGNDVKVETLEVIEYIDENDTLLEQEEQKWVDMTNCVNRLRPYTPEDWIKIFSQERDAEDLIKNKERRRLNNIKHSAIRSNTFVNCKICSKELKLCSLWGHMKYVHSQ